MGSCASKVDLEKFQKIDFQKLLETGRTGDILLVSGTLFAGKMTKFGTKSHWSHCGLLVRNPPQNLIDLYKCRELVGLAHHNPSYITEKEELFVFDSDWESDDSISGTALRPLATVLYSYLDSRNHGSKVKIGFREAYSLKDRDIETKEAENQILETCGILTLLCLLVFPIPFYHQLTTNSPSIYLT